VFCFFPPCFVPKGSVLSDDCAVNKVIIDSFLWFSVGEIRLKSADPLTLPSIQPNYFSDPEGVRKLLFLLSVSFD